MTIEGYAYTVSTLLLWRLTQEKEEADDAETNFLVRVSRLHLVDGRSYLSCVLA